MISAEQINASRALLGWSAAELVKRSIVGETTLRPKKSNSSYGKPRQVPNGSHRGSNRKLPG